MGILLTKRELALQEDVSVRTVERHAERWSVQVSEEKHRNGRPKRLYQIEPAVEQPAQTAISSQIVLPASGLLGANFSDEDQAEANRRFSIIERLLAPEKYPDEWAMVGHKREAMIASLGERGLGKRSTILGWLKKFNEGGLPALVDRDRSDKGAPRKVTPAGLEFLARCSIDGRSASAAYEEYEAERRFRLSLLGKPLETAWREQYKRYLDSQNILRPEAQLPTISRRTLAEWYARIPEAPKVMARFGVEAYANVGDIISHRDIAALRPLQYIVLDHRRLDLFCIVRRGNGWEVVRPWLSAAIDFRTRKWLSWNIVVTPSSDSIASVLKRAFVDWGIPDGVYIDNGADFSCEYLEGSKSRRSKTYRVGEFEEGIRGVLETLQVRITHAIVRRARSKIVEPAFIATANFDKTTPWYCGHRPNERPEKLGQLVAEHERWIKGEAQQTPFREIEHIAWLYDSLLKGLNERELVGARGMEKPTPTGRGWMCPNEAWEILIGGVPRRFAPPEVIQCCFHRRKEITVMHSEVKFTLHGRTCHYRLDEPEKLLTMNGRKVQVAYDPFDLETVALYHEDRFLGLATDVELRRMGEQDFVADERDRRRARRTTKELIDLVHRTVPLASPEERATRRNSVLPVRSDPARAIVPVELPSGILLEVEARRAQASRFDVPEQGVAPIEVVKAQPQPALDDNWSFFGDDEGGAN